MTNGEKAGIREVFNMVKPLGEGQVRIETKLDTFIELYNKAHEALENKVDKASDCIKGKISIRAFALWLSSAVIVIGAILGYLKFLKVM
jgi:hypothetical protein